MVLTNNHGDAAGQTLLNRLRDSLNQSGTLHVLRNGFDVLGVKSKVKMAQFKPALAMNPDIMQQQRSENGNQAGGTEDKLPAIQSR